MGVSVIRARLKDAAVFSSGRPLRGILPQLCLLLPVLGILFCPGCRSLFSVGGDDNEFPEPQQRPESVITEVFLETLSWDGSARVACDSLDVLVFSAAGRRELELHRRCGFNDSLNLRTTPGDKLLALLSDSPFRLNTALLNTFDAVELLVFNFQDDNPTLPIRTAQGTFLAGSRLEVRLQPLMCRVVVESVTNAMDGYKLFENPRAFLSNVNPQAEAFRTNGFCWLGQAVDTLKTPLPCDIGLFTQYPGTQLFCYPNDVEPSISNPATVLNLEGECDGVTRCFPLTLPPLQRGCSVSAEFLFDETDYSARVL